MLVVFIRTIILYVIIVIQMRFMGKRQIGQLQPSELVVALIVADLAAVPMANIGIPIMFGIIPLVTLFIMEELLAFISLKSETARKILSGTPSILIQHGMINEKELRKQRFGINDLLEEMRIKGYTDIKDIEYGILEISGELSLVPKSEKRPVNPADLKINPGYEGIPITIILDGKVNRQNLAIAGKDEKWLQIQLKSNKVSSEKNVLFAYINNQKQLIIQTKNS